MAANDVVMNFTMDTKDMDAKMKRISDGVSKIEKETKTMQQSLNAVGSSGKGLDNLSKQAASASTNINKATTAAKAFGTTTATTTKQATDGLKSMDAQINKTSADLSKMGSSGGGKLANMFADAKQQLAGLAGAAALGGALKTGFDEFVRFEQAEVAFKTLVGDAAEAEAAIKKLSDFAKSTPFELPALQQASQTLLAAGFSTGELIPTLKKLGDVAAGVNAPLEQLVQPFKQMKGTGKAALEDIMQLADAGVPIFKELEKNTGKTFADLKAMSEQGIQLDFADVDKALNTMTQAGGAFFGMMDKQSKTVGGQMANMKDNFVATMREAIEPMMGGFSKLADVMNVGIQVAGSVLSVFGEFASMALMNNGNIVMLATSLAAYQVAQKGATVQTMLDSAEKLKNSTITALTTAKTQAQAVANVLMGNTATGAAGGFNALKAAMMATPIGAIVAGIGALVAGLVAFNEVQKDGAAIQEILNEGKANAEAAQTKEIDETRALFATMKDGNATMAERESAMRRLQIAQQDNIAMMGLEKASMEEMIKMEEQLIKVIETKAAMKAQENVMTAMVEEFGERIDSILAIMPESLEKGKAATLKSKVQLYLSEGFANANIEKAGGTVSALSKEAQERRKQEILAIADELAKSASSGGGIWRNLLNQVFNPNSSDTTNLKKNLEDAALVFADMAVDTSQIQKLQNAQQARAAAKTAPAATAAAAKQAKELELEAIKAETKAIEEQTEKIKDNIKELERQAKLGFTPFGDKVELETAASVADNIRRETSKAIEETIDAETEATDKIEEELNKRKEKHKEYLEEINKDTGFTEAQKAQMRKEANDKLAVVDKQAQDAKVATQKVFTEQLAKQTEEGRLKEEAAIREHNAKILREWYDSQITIKEAQNQISNTINTLTGASGVDVIDRQGQIDAQNIARQRAQLNAQLAKVTDPKQKETIENALKALDATELNQALEKNNKLNEIARNAAQERFEIRKKELENQRAIIDEIAGMLDSWTIGSGNIVADNIGKTTSKVMTMLQDFREGIAQEEKKNELEQGRLAEAGLGDQARTLSDKIDVAKDAKEKAELQKELDKVEKKQKELKKENDKLEKGIGKAQTVAIIDLAGAAANQVLDITNQMLAQQIAMVDEQIEKQKLKVDAAKQNAEKGGAEQLQLEQERLDKLTEQRKKYIEDQKNLAKVELIINSGIAVAKAAAVGGPAAGITIALTLAALAAGLLLAQNTAEKVAQGWYEGGYTGSGNPRDVAGNVHKGEFVFPKSITDKNRSVFEEIHSGKVDLHKTMYKASILDNIMKGKLQLKRDFIKGAPIIHYSGMKDMSNKLDELTRVVKEQERLSININEDGIVAIVNKAIRNGDRIRQKAK